MSEATRLLAAIEAGEPQAAERLLPLVYDELRRLAAQKLAHEQAGQTLDATGLVHEAYLRLAKAGAPAESFAGRRHFFAAAAEAMRRILIDNARRKGRLRHGGGRRREELAEHQHVSPEPDLEALAVGEALDQFAAHDPASAELVKLHCFAGLTLEQAAEALGLSVRSAYRDWSYARAWLFRRLEGGAGEPAA